MSKIYEAVIVAIRDHWKNHDNQYPQKILLTSAQHRELLDHRRAGSVALNDDSKPEPDVFMGTALGVDDRTTGVVVAVDGTETALSIGG
jgi:hypothetical protein